MAFIADAVRRVRAELAAAGVVSAEVYGRPKHIYSIWNKMRKKGVEFSEVYDIRALRIIVEDLKDCYTALGIVHNLWSPISKEFDDYISNPKGNYYRSLHTAVRCPADSPEHVASGRCRTPRGPVASSARDEACPGLRFAGPNRGKSVECSGLTPGPGAIRRPPGVLHETH